MVKRIGVLTSGGDAPGMNAAIRAVTRSAIARGIEVVGIYDGFKGMYEGKMELLSTKSVSDVMIRGGTIIGTARLPEFKDESVRKVAIENLKKFEVEAVVVIGGDGSYRGAMALTNMGINCIGLPGTIDNDIVSTEYTIGFDTALNTVIQAIDKLRDTSSSHHRCSVVEVMGNRCGDLALYSGLSCGAEIIITPETGYDEVEVLNKLRYFEEVKHKNHAIVVISEKITDVEMLAQKISNATKFSGRATVLGHVQRGGSPTAFDRVLATRMGDKAVELLANNIGGQCVGMINNKIVSIDINEALAMPKASRKHLSELHERLV
ncbi:MAG: 6-phosphofructokinase [Firmicutes bacterium GWF2_51_9]|nr:MAG: 6-phosphofructokinase [Firmicutes bacterium GWF2_51_9]OGS58860.1 MAG: 6-phosphofructokinase [Firmicutes bacterium GWE2_51_13]HAM63542.1 6-phosphofructokinase [Erysipelotrichaceae bacterium]HBZ41022.1 6-phosphofructokinase [Erysipelotrichaceae bacterium]